MADLRLGARHSALTRRLLRCTAVDPVFVSFFRCEGSQLVDFLLLRALPALPLSQTLSSQHYLYLSANHLYLVEFDTSIGNVTPDPQNPQYQYDDFHKSQPSTCCAASRARWLPGYPAQPSAFSTLHRKHANGFQDVSNQSAAGISYRRDEVWACKSPHRLGESNVRQWHDGTCLEGLERIYL